MAIDLWPLLSAKAFGKLSKAFANFLTAYCSKPGKVSAYFFNWMANSASVAPAPGTYLPSLVKHC